MSLREPNPVNKQRPKRVAIVIANPAVSTTSGLPSSVTAFAVLRYACLPNGELLAKGKTVTGFANIEEDYADKAVWEMGVFRDPKQRGQLSQRWVSRGVPA